MLVMRNQDKWTPSKFAFRNGELVASRNPKELGSASRLMANVIASFYGKNIPHHVSGRLIDLGCGKVPLFAAYRNYISENICVDWGETLHKNEYLDHECDLTKELPFRDGEFNTVILSDVLEHLPQPEHIWKEMARILAVGGKALISVPFYYWLHEVPHDYYRYTEYGLRRFAQLHNFKVVLLKPLGGTPEILADILAKHLQYVPLIGNILAIGVQSLTSAFVRTNVGKRLSERTSKLFPFGYFLVVEKIDG